MKAATKVSTVTMITGSNRGIGLSLTQQALAKGHRVVAACRVIADCPELQDWRLRYPQQLSLHQMDIISDSSVRECFKSITESGVHHIDNLISNAGVYGKGQDNFSNLSINDMLETFQVNTLGSARVIQGGLPLLSKSAQGKIVGITSRMGSIEDNGSGGSYGYRVSKAALNMHFKNLSLEFPELISLLIHPGWVKTRMGGANAPVEVADSAAGILRVLERVTREQSGLFLDYQGKDIPW